MSHHVVTLKTDPATPAVVYLSTPPDLAETMGGFGPARFVGHHPPMPGVSYALPATELDKFRVYATNRGVTVVDSRPRTQRPGWMERPLPECADCGYPARRGHTPTHCPNCDAPWVGVQQ